MLLDSDLPSKGGTHGTSRAPPNKALQQLNAGTLARPEQPTRHPIRRSIPLPESKRRILVSQRMFEPTLGLLDALREHRRLRGGDEITEKYDAFMLDPGLGPPVYLSCDGRIIWDDDGWGVVGTRADAIASVLAGIKKTGIVDLRNLLPVRPSASVDCPECDATGWFDAHGQFQDVNGRPFSIICMTCAGLGWTDHSLVLT